jgi:hypothetical protein
MLWHNWKQHLAVVAYVSHRRVSPLPSTWIIVLTEHVGPVATGADEYPHCVVVRRVLRQPLAAFLHMVLLANRV